MVTARELAEQEIAVYTVGCEPSITPYRDWFMAVSHITSGQYVPLLSAELLSQVLKCFYCLFLGQHDHPLTEVEISRPRLVLG